MKYVVGIRYKFMVEVEDVNKKFCVWVKEFCLYFINRECLKFILGEKEDIVDLWFWFNNYLRIKIIIGFWLWVVEEGNIDDEIGEKIKLLILEDNVFNFWFWKENEESIVEVFKREEFRLEAEEEDIIGFWFWVGDEDRFELVVKINEENKIVFEDEDIVGFWFWGNEEVSLEVVRRGIFEFVFGIKEEKVIGLWFWIDKVKVGVGF